jgi:Calcineurin-like phosphoesterase
MTISPDINYDQLSADLEQKLEAVLTADVSIPGELWAYLQLCEKKLCLLMAGGHPSDSSPGKLEFGPTLYLMNNDLSRGIEKKLRGWGMPQSGITVNQWDSWKPILEQGAGEVGGDGTLISTVTFAQLDPAWALTGVFYLYYYFLGAKKATFGIKPVTVNIGGPPPQPPPPASLTIAVMGDWGTGQWQDGTYNSPAVLVGNAINSLKPDIMLHLGDVYYSGISFEESARLLQAFPKGSKYNFTMNSNHEMYDGGNGYFGTALKNPLFTLQNQTSYFVINYADWVLVALDSAFYDQSFFVMEGGLNAGQQAFVQGLNIDSSKKVVMFTHHTALTTDGSDINNKKDPNNLFAAVYTALNKRYPDFWYYGHTHNGIVYNDKSVTKNYTTAFNRHPQIRCVGHAAIPFGNGYDLYDNTGKPIPVVDYYAHTPLPQTSPVPDPRQKKRVLNGFAILTLKSKSLTEDFYEVYPAGTKQKIWSKTHQF